MFEYREVLDAFTKRSVDILQENLVGIYLHGSAAMGCFNPRSSDIDLIIVVREEIPNNTKRCYMDMVVEINKLAPVKGIELSVVKEDVCNPFVYPTPYELHFSVAHLDWYKRNPQEYIEKMKGRDKDLAAHFTIIIHRGKTLYGRDIKDVFGEVSKDIIDSYDWKMCQIQLNILDENHQAGLEGLRYAGSKGIPVVIMEPLRGGKLAHNVPKDVAELWNQFEVKRSPVEWAFRWLYNFPEVTVILSGVSTMEQLKDNLEIFSKDDAVANSMSNEELELVKKVQAQYESKIKVGCTACDYCMPCPSGVDIPGTFALYNDFSMFEGSQDYKDRYQSFIEDGKDASNCVECGQCESECPQHISIIEKLKEAHAALTS
jgi:predicted nucleotidyltransferase/ferredoxin